MDTERFAPFDTRRLTVRTMTDGDLERFVDYRSDPDIARYQDWPVPYPADDARRLIGSVSTVTRPIPGEWIQLAVALRDAHEQLIGDVAIRLEDHGRIAELGATLAPAAHGNGYAEEVTAAVADRLFALLDVVRIEASTDPANRAAMRVLERVGFDHEVTAPSSVEVRGELVDDARWSLLPDGRAEWAARPTGPPADVRLVEIGPGNQRDVENLRTFHTQRRMVSSVLESFADALIPDVVDGHPVTPWHRAIEADGEIAGFVMVADRDEHHPEPYLWRLLVDRRHQGRGIGARVVNQVIDRAREQGAESILVSYVPEPGGPQPFYAKLGFEETGETKDGEVYTRLRL